MQSFIICEKNESARISEINTRLQTLGITPFDVITPDTNAPSIGIAEVKAFIKKLSLYPLRGTKSAGVIVHGELLTLEAQQALLKTLEEPPNHVVLFIGADNSAQLLPTIMSRCHIIVVKKDSLPPDEKDLAAVRKQIGVILTSPLGERIAHIQSVGNTREEYDNWLERAIATLRIDMLTFSAASTWTNISQVKIDLLRRLLKAKQYSLNNVNSLFLLEHALLTLGSKKWA